MLAIHRRSGRSRRGVTLVEMLVVVALVILMMVILVQVFQQASGAMTSLKATQELDVVLRSVDLMLRSDLGGVTAKMTPPNDPSLKQGYFEYGENAFADLHGEDTDDYLAFTTKAPPGRSFAGRVYVSNINRYNPGVAGNLAVQPVTVTSQVAEVIYFLRNGNLYRRVFLVLPNRPASTLVTGNNSYPFPALGANVGWLGVNDLSARPNSTGLPAAPVLNDLGDLTNRENRAFRPRFRSDYYPINVQDGFDDDLNGDDVADFYPTLYPNAFHVPGLVNEVPYPAPLGRPFPGSYDVYAFPYLYPGMYSRPDPTSLTTGWVHSLDPSQATSNHAPLGTGDNLPTPDPGVAAQCQTWWGFPTWRETLSPLWLDPNKGVIISSNPSQQHGLKPIPPQVSPQQYVPANLLPPVLAQYSNDGAGFTGKFSFATFVGQPGVWDDDLILTNVRSFDVKAYDPVAPLYSNDSTNFLTSGGYYDLGYGVQGTPGLSAATPTALWGVDNQPQGFGHAGRMPPMVNDFRLNPSRPSMGNGVNNNFVGDDGATLPVSRLTRVWDSWSTDYTNAPDTDIHLNGYAPQAPIYPSYPAPYTSPLRGIQIQVRVADPRNEHVKVLTIRQDFTDKL